MAGISEDHYNSSMDKTIDTYNQHSDEYAQRHKSQAPLRLYELAKVFFIKDGNTLDLGSGIGRDTHWLNTNNFPAMGIDPSEGMLEIAKTNHPDYRFIIDQLPVKSSVGQFDNVFCCAVIMHVPRSELISAIVSILNVTKTNGRIIISYRDGNNENDGRLFETYHIGQVAQLFESLGGKVLLTEEEGQWKNIVIEKLDLQKCEGLRQIQDIISTEKKTATYKFALLRALCEISRYEPHVVTWYRDGDMVLVPLKRIAARWVQYYFPLTKAGIKQTTNKKMAFEDLIHSIEFGQNEYFQLKDALEKNDPSLDPLLKKVAKTIKDQPAKYSGNHHYEIFQSVSKLDASVYPELKHSELGMITVPLSIWRDLNFFSHWIEDSLSIQWAELTEKINKDRKFAKYLDLITKTVQEDERSTYLVRSLFKNKNIHCVWTGKEISQFAVDHMLPWSIWRNNDLWNMLPSDSRTNGQKSDRIPSIELIRKRFGAKNGSIKGYWETFANHHENLFAFQLDKSLGLELNDAFTSTGLEALEQMIVKTQIKFGTKTWSMVG